jgi:DNA-directed RNA polymerase subunit beta'
VNTSALKEGEDVKEPLSERILGRVAVHDVKAPMTGNIMVKAGEIIDEEVAQAVSETSIEQVEIRSVLTCESKRGVCARCYGRNLTTGKLVEVGETVGIIAAQSIGEPGTQLTLRTFHTGGTASLIASQSHITSKFDGVVKYEGIKSVKVNTEDGERILSLGRSGIIHVLNSDNAVLTKYDVPYGAMLQLSDGAKVQKGQLLYEWDPYNATIMSEHAGIIKYQDLKENITYRDEPDEQTGHIQKVVIESRDRNLSPSIMVVDKSGKKIANYIIPTRAHILVDDGDVISAGMVLVKIPRDIGKTRDITGGLPRVTELFEARSPQDPAVVSEIDGIVSFGAQKRGSREVIVTSHDGREKKIYMIPLGKHVLVQENDMIRSGERLSDGAIDPHDILLIKGTSAVQEYLVNEIQEVYRMQGVKINDKHIEIIVRQMMQKVRVTDPGDTHFLEGDYIDKVKFEETNRALEGMVFVENKGDSKLKNNTVVEKKKIKELNVEFKKREKKTIEARDAEPALSEPVLLGITTASLSTDSFISAASFQETTKVLTDAAIEGKVDRLLGLKENVIMGHLIPAGTGLKKFREVMVVSKKPSRVIEKTVVSEEVADEIKADEVVLVKKARKKAKSTT